MFSWWGGGKLRRLQKAYEGKLVEARDVQRNGDIVHYSKLIAESEAILAEIDEVERGRDANAGSSTTGP